MTVCQLFISIFLFSALQDGNIGHVHAEIPTYTGKEGGNITVSCPGFPPFGIRFCKGRCEEGNILIESQESSAQRGRYSIENRGRDFNVSIAQLQKSDVGRYRCSGFRMFYNRGRDKEFDITVIEDSPKTTKPSKASLQDSDSTEAPITASGFFLPVIISVSVVVVLLPVVLLLIYKKKDFFCGSRSKRSDHNKAEEVIYENCSAVSTHEDSVYQSLNTASMEQNQTYCTLHNTKQGFY